MNIGFPLKTFKSSNGKALAYLILPALLGAGGWSMAGTPVLSLRYMVSQLMLGLFFFQCFILLHETGHYSFFKSRLLNTLFGHVFALLSLIPFKSWIGIHNLHHKWTGYRDKDPTTEGTVSPQFGPFSKALVNLSWKFWLPLFTLGYRYTYWNLPKIKKHLPASQARSIQINMLLMLLPVGLMIAFGGSGLLKMVLPAYGISLMISDVFILSQHSHIEIPLAGEARVKPLRYADQIPYTRSLRLHPALAPVLYFNFNLHELHHAYPGLPAYHLHKIKIDTPNAVNFADYLREAKSMSGVDFVFRTSSGKIGSKPEQKQ